MVSYFQSTRKLDFFSSHVKLATLKKKSSSPLNIQSYSTSESSKAKEAQSPPFSYFPLFCGLYFRSKLGADGLGRVHLVQPLCNILTYVRITPQRTHTSGESGGLFEI